MHFADILASSIHDIKNSLSLIINRLEALIDDPDNRIHDMVKARSLQTELQRANNNMIQLLSLYKMGFEQFSLAVREVNLDDLLSELVAENQPTTEALGLHIRHDCDPYLCGYFDEDLVRGVLNSSIGNAQRYAKGAILLSAEQQEDHLVIRIEDDGTGYPEAMLESLGNFDDEEAFSSGRTHLGLFFADQVARMHRSGERQGGIHLSNGGPHLSGSCFELRLP